MITNCFHPPVYDADRDDELCSGAGGSGGERSGEGAGNAARDADAAAGEASTHGNIPAVKHTGQTGEGSRQHGGAEKA